MFLKIYEKYLIKEFLLFILKVTFVFLVLGVIMNVIEELRFFGDYDVSYYLPILIVLLNLPSLIFEIFPFIILISVIFLFLKIIENGELLTFKNNKLTNTNILRLIASVTFIIGIIMVLIFYNFASLLKFSYIGIKQNYTTDSKYLSAITENGIWIKDENEEFIIFVNAKKIENEKLIDTDITLLDKDFNYKFSINSNEINIKKKEWSVIDANIIDENNNYSVVNEYILLTNFDYKKINRAYSELNSLTVWGLLDLKKDYISVNYSTTDIDLHLQKILSYPIYLTIMSLFAMMIMFNIKTSSNKIFYLTLSILLSVSIYYINHFFGLVGKTEKVPILVSVWFPILILFIASAIGFVNLNEK